MSEPVGRHPPLDPPGTDHAGAEGEIAPDTELDSSLTPTAASTDPEAAFEAERAIDSDPALSPAGAQGAEALSGSEAAKGGTLWLYLGALVALALVAAAIWAALR